MPTSLLIWPVGQAVKTAASHAVNVGSIPARVTCWKHQNLTIIRSVLVLFSLSAFCIPHFYHTRVIMSREKLQGRGRSVVPACSIKAKWTTSKGAFAAYPRSFDNMGLYGIPCPLESLLICFWVLIAEQTESISRWDRFFKLKKEISPCPDDGKGEIVRYGIVWIRRKSRTRRICRRT